jgi:hypothetical protein
MIVAPRGVLPFFWIKFGFMERREATDSVAIKY